MYVLSAALVLLLTGATALAATIHRFEASLKGNHEVPPVTTKKALP